MVNNNFITKNDKKYKEINMLIKVV